MNLKEKKEKIQVWVKEHKAGLEAAGLMIGASIAMVGIAVFAAKAIGKQTVAASEPLNFAEDFDFGRTIIMKFVDPENGNILGEIPCYESYMEDMLDCMTD